MSALVGCSPVDSWNPQTAASRVWAPCNSVYPYYHGRDAEGRERCTTRPLDIEYIDVDVQAMP